MLNSNQMGFLIKNSNGNDHKITHLVNMDDIKLYASTPPGTEINILTQKCQSQIPKNVQKDQENYEIHNVAETSQQLDDTGQHFENKYATILTTKSGKPSEFKQD